MSTFKVQIVQINGVMKHPGADRLDILQINDWQVVTQKDKYKVGDLVIYFPIDSLLPSTVEEVLFPPDSKVKLTKSRVKTIKLRGAISQGMVVDPQLFGLQDEPKGTDVTAVLGVTKFEPPVHISSSNSAATSKKTTNPYFRKYTAIENAKNYPAVFEDNEDVSVTEKIHGTNFRAGYVPFYADTLFKRIKKFLGITPSHDFVYGSHNVQLQSRLLYKGFYKTNLYAEAVVKYALKGVLKPGEVIYGEIYGDGVQKGYTYECMPGERRLVIFDVRLEDNWLDPVAARRWCEQRFLPFVPELYRGPFNKDKILELRDGDSVLAKTQKVREGVVVKPIKETTTYIGRKVLKYISDNYLLKNQDSEDIAH